MNTNTSSSSSRRGVSVNEQEDEDEVLFVDVEKEQFEAGLELVHRRHEHSSLDILHHTKNTRRRHFSKHLPSPILIQILSHLPQSDLTNTLQISRLFFHLSGPILYHSLNLTSGNFHGVFKGAASVYEAESGKIVVGRKRFKDRLLRFTRVVNLFSHGEDDDEVTLVDNDYEDDEEEEDSTKASQKECPSVPLSTLFPHMSKLQITLGDSYDYHTTFCSRTTFKSPTSSCPLLYQLSMDIQKFIIYGARSPLVILPLAFPIPKVPTKPSPSDNANGRTLPPRRVNGPPITIPSSSSTTSLGDRHSFTPTLNLGSLPTFGLLSPSPSSSSRPSIPRLVTPPLTPRPSYFRSSSSEQTTHTRTLSAPSSSSTSIPFTTHRHAHTPLPLGIRELTIIIPSGKSYDSRDYSDSPHPHIFQLGEPSLSSLELLVIVFEPSLNPTSKKRDKWQIAYYDSHLNPEWTSYFSLIEDLTIALIAIPIYTTIKLVGIEKIDGQLLGVREGRVGHVIQERIERRLEVRLRAEGREREVGERIEKCEFVDYDQYVNQLDRD